MNLINSTLGFVLLRTTRYYRSYIECDAKEPNYAYSINTQVLIEHWLHITTSFKSKCWTKRQKKVLNKHSQFSSAPGGGECVKRAL